MELRYFLELMCLVFVSALAGVLLGLKIIATLKTEDTLTILLIASVPFLIGCGLVVVARWLGVR